MRCGILIVGSLLWDDREKRIEWRARLGIDQAVRVNVPIRYGRRSDNRGKTFTMTFQAGDARGVGFLIPCLASIQTVAGLVEEAEALWEAEDLNASPHSISANWGCVGSLFHKDNTPADWATHWADHFCNRASPTTPVDAKGVLDIPWPMNADDGSPADVDVILGAATKAEGALPTAADVADAWVEQDKGYERYFLENVRRGIRTPDDGAIWQRIEDKRPPWLDADHHREAIEILRSEARQPA